MGLGLAGRIVGAVALAAGLAGCVDAVVDVEITSQTTAKATMTQTMGADFYTVMQSEGGDVAGAEEFCAEGELTETPDGGAVCVSVEEGPFETLSMGNDEATVQFADAGPGLVRVYLPTEGMTADSEADAALDAETRQVLEAAFAGRTVTLRFGGAEVVETNMTLAKDGKTAEQVIPLFEMISGTLELPEELFAVVRVP